MVDELTNNQTCERRRIETHWLFVCLGGAPRTEWVPFVHRYLANG